MLKLSKLSTLCWQLGLLAFIGPTAVKTQEATILAEVGCSAFLNWNGTDMTYRWVCDDYPTIAKPETFADGRFHYLLDVLTGFPVDIISKKTRPKFRQRYKWTNDNLVTIGRDNCVYANLKFLGDIYVKHVLGDQIGECPPTNNISGEYGLFENPYYNREMARKAANSVTTTSDFVADNVGMPNIPNTVNTPIGFSAEASLPQPADEVAFGTMDFFSADFPSGAK